MGLDRLSNLAVCFIFVFFLILCFFARSNRWNGPAIDHKLSAGNAGSSLRGLSNEVSPKGIRVVTVFPGFTETDAATRMIQGMADHDKSDYTTSRQKLMDMIGGIPLGRPNPPDEARNATGSATRLRGGLGKR